MDDNEIHQMLGKILANQEGMKVALLEHFKDDKYQFGDIRKRITTVETKINRAGGALAVVSALALAVFGGWFK